MNVATARFGKSYTTTYNQLLHDSQVIWGGSGGIGINSNGTHVTTWPVNNTFSYDTISFELSPYGGGGGGPELYTYIGVPDAGLRGSGGGNGIGGNAGGGGQSDDVANGVFGGGGGAPGWVLLNNGNNMSTDVPGEGGGGLAYFYFIVS